MTKHTPLAMFIAIALGGAVASGCTLEAPPSVIVGAGEADAPENEHQSPLYGDEEPVEASTPAPIATPTSSPTQAPTAAPTATPAPTPAPSLSGFSGSGQEATKTFALEAGLAVFQFQHTGEGYFGVWLLDAQGDRVDLVANDTGSAEGKKGTHIPTAGSYLLDVEAGGSWSVKVEQPRPTTAPAPSTYTGSSNNLVGPFQWGGGLMRCKLTHAGEGYFGVWLLAKDGSRVDLLGNAAGAFDGSKAAGVDPGIYYLSVEADGAWSVAVE